MNDFGTPFYDFLIQHGFSEFWTSIIRSTVFIIILFLFSSLFNFLGRRIFLNLIVRFTEKTKSNYDDIFLENRVFYKITLLFPAIGIYLFDDIILIHASYLRPYIIGATNVYSIIIIAVILSAVFKSLEDIMAQSKPFKDKPLTSYRQLLDILNYGVAIILVISILIDKSPMYLLSAMGAATAILLLVFRDSILGLTASIQLASNDMIRVGDWVTVSSYGADGDVMEITLNTVKVRNFDKTITTVPTYAFISNSFKNWRGMEESKGRRIKRAIHIKIDSICFADNDLIDRLEKVDIIQGLIQTKKEEIDRYNIENKVNTNSLINGRRQTNVGLFRSYLVSYLKNNPNVNTDLTYMVRQLDETNYGLPLEIYCFSREKDWVIYEGIMSDIFDHIYASAPYFNLEIFQSPSGKDFRQLKREV
ncbi:MAG: mechanosensitive ion channel protein MscS [Crocinitomicaceae bacterium]|nr:mechanosensitive ion channel protein MscS [Crocinitomicaceae bacterium]|tara:strand:+ start:13411 stop:14670 length:1260 start_codon:yes stop_codon:yes gene_type:complete